MIWSVNDVSDMCEGTPEDVQRTVTDMKFYDETTGEQLDQRQAKNQEPQRFKHMGVYDHVARQQ